jgi:cobalt transporter subunit CbtA
MTGRIFASALYAGLAAGLVAAALQFVFVIPLLLEGELYETGARVHYQARDVFESPAGAPALGWDLRRHGLTIAMSVISYTAFALLLVAAMAAAARRGVQIDARRGLIWGVAGFFAVSMAPAFGLPPELPGTMGAPIGARQFWWAATMALSAAGIALIALPRGEKAPLLALGGAMLLLLPHLWGAPHLELYFGIAPPELAALFSVRSLGVAAVGWTVLGIVAGYFWQGQRASATG